MVFALYSKVVQNLAAVVEFVCSIIKTLDCCAMCSPSTSVQCAAPPLHCNVQPLQCSTMCSPSTAFQFAAPPLPCNVQPLNC